MLAGCCPCNPARRRGGGRRRVSAALDLSGDGGAGGRGFPFLWHQLERAIPGISQEMLIQQLRQMERDGIVRRIVHHQVPPKVEYGLMDWGQALCPALDALLRWASLRQN